jgi:hypothetical protein
MFKNLQKENNSLPTKNSREKTTKRNFSRAPMSKEKRLKRKASNNK